MALRKQPSFHGINIALTKPNAIRLCHQLKRQTSGKWLFFRELDHKRCSTKLWVYA